MCLFPTGRSTALLPLKAAVRVAVLYAWLQILTALFQNPPVFAPNLLQQTGLLPPKATVCVTVPRPFKLIRLMMIAMIMTIAVIMEIMKTLIVVAYDVIMLITVLMYSDKATTHADRASPELSTQECSTAENSLSLEQQMSPAEKTTAGNLKRSTVNCDRLLETA